jgi:hypothetical protein
MTALFAPVESKLIDDAGTWAANKVSDLIAKEPTWAQKPTAIIGTAIIDAAEEIADVALGITPEQLTMVTVHATMNHPAVIAANPATIAVPVGNVSPAKPASTP